MEVKPIVVLIGAFVMGTPGILFGAWLLFRTQQAIDLIHRIGNKVFPGFSERYPPERKAAKINIRLVGIVMVMIGASPIVVMITDIAHYGW